MDFTNYIPILCQEWEESERGWGVRPDGFSLHISVEEHQKYIKNFWKNMPKIVPYEYSRESGAPFWVYTPKSLYEEIQKRSSIRLYNEYTVKKAKTGERYLTETEYGKRTRERFRIKDISDILTKHDKHGLIAIGAPSDEYDSEAKMIYQQLSRCKSISDVQTLIYSVYVTQFSIDSVGKKTDYAKLAKEIFKYYQDSNKSKPK